MALNRGLNPIFHGRKEELKQFEFFLNHVEKDHSRTSFLIQGAPGAGKTSLAEKCYELAQKKGWRLVRVDVPTLLDLKEFRKRLGREPLWKIWQKRKITLPLQVDKIGFKAEWNFDHHTIVKTLNAVHKPTIIGFDEAQMLGHQDITSQEKLILRNVLDQLHNQRGTPKSPIIFLMNGLGRTQDILEEYDISRFSSESVIHLTQIDRVSERNILYDWIVQKANISPDESNLNHWISEISQHTHQWPVHITAYGLQVEKHIQEHGTKLNNEGLSVVLDKGFESRQQYYRRRTRRLSIQECETIVSFLLLNNHPKEFTQEDLTQHLKQHLGTKQGEQVFNTALHYGVIHQQNNKKHAVSVPSMQTWLIENFTPKHLMK